MILFWVVKIKKTSIMDRTIGSLGTSDLEVAPCRKITKKIRNIFLNYILELFSNMEKNSF
jgi:hypothetical protein